MKKDLFVFGVIPARGGSKGLPRKNIRLLAGKPLIAYSIQAAQTSTLVTDFVVSTDDEEIAAVARQWGAGVPFLRPAYLSTDEASSLDVVLHALEWVEAERQIRVDILVLLQPTAPLRLAEDIDRVIRHLIDTGADAAVSFSQPLLDNPHYMYTLDNDRPEALLPGAIGKTRRQDLPQVYIRNGAVYAVHRNVFVEQKSFYGRDWRAVVMPRQRSVNIDDEFDLRFAEFLLSRED